jgi:hypothetical protein
MSQKLLTRKINKPRKKYRGRTKRKEKCSPYANGRSIVNGSCFTKGIVMDLKNTFNKQNLTNQIKSNNPEEVYNMIKKKLPYCKKESCWIQEVANPRIKHKLLSLLFAPPQPTEWRLNPSAWLSNIDILDVLTQYEKTFPNFYFIGPSAIDYNYRDPENNNKCVCPKLCNFSLQDNFKQKKNKIGIVFNLDKHNQSGSHWVSLFIDIKDKFVFYFDSTSDTIPTEVNTFISTLQEQGKHMKPEIIFKLYENSKTEHQKGNNECGMYSLFFNITMLTREIKGKKIDKTQLINLFLGREGRIRDQEMNNLRDDYFSK